MRFKAGRSILASVENYLFIKQFIATIKSANLANSKNNIANNGVIKSHIRL